MNALLPPLWARWNFATLALIAILTLTLGCSKPPGVARPSAEAGNAPADSSVSSVEPGSESSDEPAGDSTSSDQSAVDPSAEHSQPDREPVSQHEALFQGWPPPQVALLITGQQHGYIEPCGCTGLANQKGGLSRRHTLALQLVEKGWPLIPIDAGNQVRRFGRQAEIKFHMTVEALQKMGYQATGLGVDDLRLSVLELYAPIAGEQIPFVNANAAVLDQSTGYQVVEAGGVKLGVVAVMGTEAKKEITADEITTSLPDEAIERILPQLAAAKCDHHVLLAQASIEEAKRLGRKYDKFNIVVAAGGDDPTYQPETIESGAMFMQTGMKSKFVMVVGLFDDPQQPFRYQRVPLDDRFPDSRDMLDLLAAYQDQLKGLGLDGLGLKPIPHPSGAKFVGSGKCAECHTTAYEIWQETPHYDATQALVEPSERSEIPRHFDPECLSCHVTGWHPQRYFPYSSGYLGLEQSVHLHGNGCENCHGPGSRHVAAESGELDLSDEDIEKLRESMSLPLAKAEENCLQCHDLDNDPDFQEPGAFEEYWERIKHGLD